MRAFIVRYPHSVCKSLGMRHGARPPRGACPFSPCPQASPHGAFPCVHVGGSTACQPPRSSRQYATPVAGRSRSGRAVSSHPSRLHCDRPGTHTRARGIPTPREAREAWLFSSARVTAIDRPKAGATTPRPHVTRSRPGGTERRPTSGPGACRTPRGVKTREPGSATPCPPRHGPRREDGLRAPLVAADTPAWALGLWRWTRWLEGMPRRSSACAVHGVEKRTESVSSLENTGREERPNMRHALLAHRVLSAMDH